jgi:UDP-glucose 4-epimerase
MPERVIVTGGCGFLGREVVAQLVARGDEVIVLDDLSKDPSEGTQGVAVHRVDLTDIRESRTLFGGARKCIHLAARIGGIGYFHRVPATILNDNGKMLASVFEACAHHRYERIVYFSSSMVFERSDRFPTKETDLASTPAPASAYGFSKLLGEYYCRAFCEERRLPFSIVRPFNAYGIHEAPGREVGEAHVIPDLVRKLLEGQDPLEIHGDGLQTRCFTHASDIARAALLALDSPAAENEDFNVSSPGETSILELAEKLWAAVGRKGPLRVKHVPSWQHDVKRRVPDVTKARRLLRFEARVQLEDELPAIVEWIRGDIARRGPGRSGA